MITEERLKELIEQKATIYYAIPDVIKEVEPIPLNEEYYLKISNGYLMSITDNEYFDYLDFEYSLEDLFETKDDAEWYLEFGNITRTETLELPTWEEARKDLYVEIYSPKGRKYLLQTKIITGYSCERENPYIIRIDRVGYANSQIDFEYTKENYIKACRLAKKLFLGEEI